MTGENSDAYGRRQRIRIHVRRILYDSLRLWQKLFGRNPRGDFLQVVTTGEDVNSRLSWYLPNCSIPVVSIPSERGLTQTGARQDDGLDPSLREAAVDNQRLLPGKPHTVYSGPIILSAARVLRSPAHTTLVSSSLYRGADTLGYLRIRRAFEREPVAGSTADWPLQAQPPHPNSWAVLIATGPTADDFDFASVAGADVRIICNSGVRSSELLRSFKPNVVCFGDPVFHMGPSRYAHVFRDDLSSALDQCPDMVAVVPEQYRTLLWEQVPAVRGRIAGLTLARVPRGVPERAQGALARRTGNILTQQMLPIALQSVPRRISLVGCDGRDPSERYFWRHGQVLQYDDDLMQSVFECHPSFFRDVSYADYYERHCREVGGWVQFAAEQGAVVDTLTRSFIPALADRSAEP